MKEIQDLVPGFALNLVSTWRRSLILTLVSVGFTLTSCQMQGSGGISTGDQGASSTLKSPAVAQPIATDLTKDLSGLIAKPAKLVLDADMPQAMRTALGEALTSEGYSIASAHDTQGEDIVLKLAVFEVGEDLLIRVTTPNIRLSKVYRARFKAGGETDAMGTIHVAGPPVLETIGGAIGR
ncbi:hypothetical protein D4A92_22475 (plasmid) [Rhizobium rosettiformans]|uniref:Conjugal transfer protein TrbH n=1 Tax=Rhizobium rosettiformans TaxID=1368430 RepID=A0ABX7F3C7_9HYPH|nr:hypothetical protein D4A92_22475 [Rhizobium rosettiformans]